MLVQLACVVRIFGEPIAAPREAHRIVLLDGEHEIDRVEASASPPRFVRLHPAAGVYDLDHLELTWSITDDDGDDVRFDVYGLVMLAHTAARGKFVISSVHQHKGSFEAVASDGFWESRIVRHYAVIPGTNRIVFSDVVD